MLKGMRGDVGSNPTETRREGDCVGNTNVAFRPNGWF